MRLQRLGPACRVVPYPNNLTKETLTPIDQKRVTKGNRPL